MTESIGNKTLKQALNESLQKANSDERKVMTETLDSLNIDYSDSQKESNNINKAAKDTGAELVKTLQESILAKEQAEAKITELQEKLSVCYAKEAKYEEDISKYKNAIRNLSESASSVKTLQARIKNLSEELDAKNNLIQEKENQNNKLLENNKIQLTNKNRLSENLSIKEREINLANQKIIDLKEQLNKNEITYKQEKEQLEENYQALAKDYRIKETQYSNKLDKVNKLVEQYKIKAQTAVDKYIDSKAIILGITSQEIKNKLTENYTFDDIDIICENLGNYSLQVSNLPFNLKSIKKVDLTESRKIPGSKNFFDDGDDVDDTLIRLANNLMN